MTYSHQWVSGEAVDLPMGKVVCVGRNYAEHARELNNPIPAEPLLFMKPGSAVTPLSDTIVLSSDRGSVHYEAEIAILIGETLTSATESDARKGIIGAGLALDLTLRDLQSQLKEKGHPWEKSKCFDGSCPLSLFVPSEGIGNWEDISMRLSINGELRQDGNSAQMLSGIVPLVSYISHHFTLQPGDVVLTGTPSGVGQLATGMELKLELSKQLEAVTRVE